ncbi:TolC family protein [Tenacibaculum geojense]|uniref:TolC family protein n=1 Tax=Tenacibaculum geojense TaxID=915352 RepID=A0ABW3JQ73_9FLAO
MKRINIIVNLLMLVGSFTISAQSILTKKEALAITLENNYGIKVATNNAAIAENNTDILNSGYLPSVTATAGANYRNENQTITRQDNTSTSINNAVTKSYNASLGLNYTIFDGLGRKYNYQQLKERYNLSELQARETIENVYVQLFTTYFQIARLSENTKNLQEALLISKQRFERAKYQYEYGQSTKLDMLNAQVDVNNDSISYINSKQDFINAKRSLNVILGVNKEVTYEVETAVTFNNLLDFNEL